MSTTQTYNNSIITALLLSVFSSLENTNTYTSFMQMIQSVKTEYAEQWNYALALSNKFAERSGLSETGIVRLIVAFLLFAILFPIAMAQITSATTTSWNPAVSTVFSVLTPILVALAAALGFFAVVESRGGI